MQWNLRMTAAERGIWKSTELRRLLAEAGLEISAGKMSALWTGTPTTIRLDDLDVICAVLDCEPSELLIREPDKVAARRSAQAANGDAEPPGTPRPTPPGRNRRRRLGPQTATRHGTVIDEPLLSRSLPTGRNKPRALRRLPRARRGLDHTRVSTTATSACPAGRSSRQPCLRCGGTGRTTGLRRTTAKDCAPAATSPPRNASTPAATASPGA